MSHRQVDKKISSSTYFVFAGVYVNCGHVIPQWIGVFGRAT